jgi:Fic family protein
LNLERDAVNRSVHSSTWIEGNLLSLAQVAALSSKQEIHADQKQKQEVENCLKAMRWVLKNKTKTFSEKHLLKLHQLMTESLLSKERTGLYRQVQNYIVNAKNIVIYTPLAPKRVAPLMRELFSWLKNSREQHSIIRSAIFHHRFVAIHPFVDGNGRVARAAAQWILFERGFEPLYTLGVDEYFANDRGRYYEMIQQAHELDCDYTYWIEYVAQGVLDSVDRVAERANDFASSSNGQKIHLTPKQEEVLRLIKEEGLMSSAQICKIMNINRARVNQLVAPLVKVGIIFKEGTTRGVRYGLARGLSGKS